MMRKNFDPSELPTIYITNFSPQNSTFPIPNPLLKSSNSLSFSFFQQTVLHAAERFHSFVTITIADNNNHVSSSESEIKIAMIRFGDNEAVICGEEPGTIVSSVTAFLEDNLESSPPSSDMIALIWERRAAWFATVLNSPRDAILSYQRAISLTSESELFLANCHHSLSELLLQKAIELSKTELPNALTKLSASIPNLENLKIIYAALALAEADEPIQIQDQNLAYPFISTLSNAYSSGEELKAAASAKFYYGLYEENLLGAVDSALAACRYGGEEGKYYVHCGDCLWLSKLYRDAGEYYEIGLPLKVQRSVEMRRFGISEEVEKIKERLLFCDSLKT
jgi:hypothetical protein